MPDAFFTSNKQRKRKRSLPSSNAGPSTSRQGAKKPFSKSQNGKSASRPSSQKKRKPIDEELESDQTDDDAGLDDMDLRADYAEEPALSEEEDPDETPAEKRLRLAKIYLEDVRQDVGLGKF